MEDNHNLFSSDFMPHGHCYFWEPEIVWSHAISDSIIALAYMTIPLSLLFIFRRRRDFQFVWIMVLFAVFIFGCGATHVMDVVNIWKPYYRLDAGIRIITAIASVGTALVLIKITPEVILIPTAAEWKRVNEELTRQIKELKEKDKTIEAFKHFEYLAETLPQLVWINKPDGKAEFFNQRWYSYTGLKFEKDIRTAMELTVFPDHIQKSLSLWQESLDTGLPFEIEVCIKNQKGEYRWHMVKALPVKSQHLTILWVCTLTDIHDQKQYNQRLEEKNRQLNKINKDLDTFIYIASHDLKAPISNLEGLFMALQEEPEKQIRQEILFLIKTSIKKLKSTINDLTDVARIQIVSEEEVVEKVEVDPLLKDVLKTFDKSIEKINPIIEIEINASTLYFSKKNMRSIMYNLISNSFKYRNKEKQTKIKISSTVEDKYFVLSVKDNGVGFDTSKSEKIFSLFRRLHDHVKGSGVGLYLVKTIVENAGGTIEVYSEEGKGSEFKIFIPQKER